ncbi:hypothetical protein NDI76_00475 [Halogeometricum sp. S1BR25-6]|uniref:DUF7344 domain-containing protein n=1 Tax=Halogeometricum salsisoli TaxID=2950536 RepID=A0ABU2G8U3_9EURY|nr:hypothetical protein [Halogeometricum sp. S1BR25-6]MDS0297215.1 hypothetical protein [Halogeometricum sp. S1BR25-6]
MGREDIGTLYEMLSTDRRRRALAALKEAEGPLDRGELARRIVARRSADGPGGAGPTEAPARKVEISLSHVHLPKLEAGGVVERTGEEEYDVTPLGHDLERAARAFETRLDAETWEVEDGPAPTN